jgi:alkylation response protein AidB-like acyl-CoA dehydrogenase
MNLELTAEQQLLADTARDFVQRHGDGDPWPTISDAGWCGLLVPDADGGAGAGLLEMVLVCEALGRGPVHSALIASGTLALPQLASGERVGTLAVLEDGMRDEWDAVRMPGGSTLSGTKLLVPWAGSADVIAVATTDGLFLVEPDAGTTEIEPHDALGEEPLCSVTFDGARAEPLGSIHLERLLDRAAMARLAFAVGAADAALALSVQHAKDRHQFGRPIGSFQAVAHRCAEMRAQVDACRYLAYQAAWCLDQDLEAAEVAVTAAKSYANDALRGVFLHAHQVHGAIGFSTEHPLHRFTRVAKTFELTYGSMTRHRDRLAGAMGLGSTL